MINAPNFITLVRLLLVPVLITVFLDYRETGADIYRFAAIALFAVAMISDGLDGMLARLWNQKTVLGTFLDPIADKILLNTAVIMLSLNLGALPRFPSWFPILVLSRDCIIVIGSVLIHMIAGEMTPRPIASGKCTTLFQMLAVLWVLLLLPHYYVPLLIAAALTVVSGFEYIIMGMRQLNKTSLKL